MNAPISAEWLPLNKIQKQLAACFRVVQKTSGWIQDRGRNLYRASVVMTSGTSRYCGRIRHDLPYCQVQWMLVSCRI